MSRKPVFDAAKAAGAKFPDADAVAALDDVLTRLGVPTDAPLARDMPAIPDDYWHLLAMIESGDRPMAKAGTSTGSGLYQFLRATWIGEGGKWGMNLALPFGGLSPSRDEQTARVKTFTAKNAAYLVRAGMPINKASLYAAHFFGPQTAARVIGAKTTERADTIAGLAATRANPSILRGKTVGQFMMWLHAKTGDWAR